MTVLILALEMALVEWVRGHSTKSLEGLGAGCDCEFPEVTTTMSSDPGFCKTYKRKKKKLYLYFLDTIQYLLKIHYAMQAEYRSVFSSLRIPRSTW